jgi:hypothetical protein
MIQMAICPKLPEFWNQGRPEEVVPCEFHHAGLEGRAVSLQSRLAPFNANENVRRTLPAIWFQFSEHQFPRSREI